MTGPPQVMVVDDDAEMCTFLRSFLSERGYSPITFENAEEAVRRYGSERPAAVILDLVMPGHMDGLGALAAFKKIDRDVPVIVMSGQGRTATVVQAMKLGASDFVSKPFTEPDLDVPLTNALKQRQLSCELASLREQLRTVSQQGMLFPTTDRMAVQRDLIERAADTDATVLIRGESGTGKELVARALHAFSARRKKPFVKVNCSALPIVLLESELFGFERGAFTGAVQHKPGKFEFANHGTMFLDEISEINPSVQAKLLQVLQDGEFSRLGGKSDVHVDVRIVAATKRDLERIVADGGFREDLFLRLDVLTIHLPPLRERREEIPALTDYFFKKYSVRYNKLNTPLSQETMQLFMEHDWPGNIRELENVIKRAVVLGSEAQIRKDIAHMVAISQRDTFHGRTGDSPERRDAPVTPALPADIGPDGAEHYSLKEISKTAAREAERGLILKMLQHTRWNRKETAHRLGISYKALLYKIKENGLDKGLLTS